MLALASWNVCLFVHILLPQRKKAKIKAESSVLQAIFFLFHTKYYNVMMSSIISLWYLFWNSSSACFVFFFSLGFTSFNQLCLRSYLELHSISWSPSVQITSNSLVQEDNLRNLGVVWANILWVAKLYIMWEVAFAQAVCFTSAPLSPTSGMQKPFWNWVYHRVSTAESKKGMLRPG